MLDLGLINRYSNMETIEKNMGNSHPPQKTGQVCSHPLCGLGIIIFSSLVDPVGLLIRPLDSITA